MSETRLDVRLRLDTKELLLQAAALRNETLTQFVISTLSEAAEKVVAQHTQTTLSNRDRDTFLALLDNAPAPNPALKRAASRYRRRRSE